MSCCSLPSTRASESHNTRTTTGGSAHLQLHYEGHISADQFGEEQARITDQLDALEAEATEAAIRVAETDDLALRFDQVAALLDALDFDALWENATEAERRTLLDELLDRVTVEPDRLVVAIHGAPPLNVGFSEVGLKDSNFRGVGGETTTPSTRRTRAATPVAC